MCVAWYSLPGQRTLSEEIHFNLFSVHQSSLTCTVSEAQGRRPVKCVSLCSLPSWVPAETWSAENVNRIFGSGPCRLRKGRNDEKSILSSTLHATTSCLTGLDRKRGSFVRLLIAIYQEVNQS